MAFGDLGPFEIFDGGANGSCCFTPLIRELRNWLEELTVCFPRFLEAIARKLDLISYSFCLFCSRFSAVREPKLSNWYASSLLKTSSSFCKASILFNLRAAFNCPKSVAAPPRVFALTVAG